MMTTQIEELIVAQYKIPIDELCRRLKTKKSELKFLILGGHPIIWQDGFFSFIELLVKYLELLKPKRILEWGPGQSTKIMLHMCPDAQITCCEDSQKWFECYHGQFGHRVRFIYVDAPDRDRTDARWDAYTNPAVKGKFDLIFIDGRERAKCLHTAFKRLRPNGIVLLHDADRKHYQEGIRLFNPFEKFGNTACLKIGR